MTRTPQASTASLREVAAKLSTDLAALGIPVSDRGPVEPWRVPSYPGDCDAIKQRAIAISRQIVSTVEANRVPLDDAIRVFTRWMKHGVIVRVVGAGRARIAATIPANRLAHGGARVYVQQDVVPLPHTIKGGGMLAASASGKSPDVLDTMHKARIETRDIEIVGIARADASEFRAACDIFIGIQPEDPEARNPLRALADNEEYIISDLLDAIVVAAGRRAGFVETMWRIGHENLGPTGPYDHASRGR